MTASISFSCTSCATPNAPNNAAHVAFWAAVTCVPTAYPAAHSPTQHGVLGMTRITPTLTPRAWNSPSIAAKGTPAAIEMKHFPPSSASVSDADAATSRNTPRTQSGFTETTTTDDRLTKSTLSTVQQHPVATNGPSVCTRRFDAMMRSGGTKPAAMIPSIIAVAITPAPMNPTVGASISSVSGGIGTG